MLWWHWPNKASRLCTHSCQSLKETIFDQKKCCWNLLTPLCLLWVEADRAERSAVRVQLCLVSTAHRLKIDVCPNPHLLPHAHSLFPPLSQWPKAESKSALNGPGVPAHLIAHEKLILVLFEPWEVSPKLWGPHCSGALWHKATIGAVSPALTQSSAEGAEDHSGRH